jgi:transcriptional regulator
VYIPSHFANTNLTALHDAVERYSFATLISSRAGDMEASHLPLLIERQAGAKGTLLGHMARANRQWRDAAGQTVLAVFSGPHAYISPTWYEAEQVVPTWNYVAVHAYGCLELIEDVAEAERLLNRTVGVFEANQPRPWQISESREFIERLLQQIVAFRIPISKIEGKWKLNQNRPVEQRQRVMETLARQVDDDSREIANLMREVK